MRFTFTPADAELLYGVLASVAVPFVVSYLKKQHWPDWAKVLLAVAISLVGGGLSAYVAGKFDGALLDTGMSVIQAGGVVFMAAMVHFKTWFQPLGLDMLFNPLPTPIITVDLESPSDQP